MPYENGRREWCYAALSKGSLSQKELGEKWKAFPL